MECSGEHAEEGFEGEGARGEEIHCGLDYGPDYEGDVVDWEEVVSIFLSMYGGGLMNGRKEIAYRLRR